MRSRLAAVWLAIACMIAIAICLFVLRWPLGLYAGIVTVSGIFAFAKDDLEIDHQIVD